MRCRVRAADATFPGASAKRIVHDLLDRARAAAALSAAAETAVNIPRRPRQFIGSRADGRADIVIRQDVARTDNHEQTIKRNRKLEGMLSFRY
jgi:hypothetical protein